MLGSVQTGLGSVPTAGGGDSPGGAPPPSSGVDSAVTGLTFPLVSGTPTLTAGSPVILPGDLGVDGKLFADDGLQVTGDALVTGNAQIDGTTDLLGPVHAHAGAPVQVDDALTSNTSSNLNGTTDVNGALNVTGTTALTGLATLNGDDVAVTPSNTIAAALASWGTIGSVRYFACDTAAGNDANAGFSDVSQAAAGLVAVKTIERLMQIVPKFGNGRQARCAIKAGNYASDTQVSVTGFSGYQRIVFTGTDTVASAGATAFLGDSNDTLCAGMTTGTGLNAAGYNITAYAVDGTGTPTATLQLNGGGAPAFGAMPAMPYGCRIRGDVATTTAALRNFCTAVMYVPATNQLMFSLPLAANPVAGDVFYIEMPGVTGPAATLINYAGADSNVANPSLGLTGLSLGAVTCSMSRVRFSSCNCTNFIGFGNQLFANENTIAVGSSPTLPVIGYGLRGSGLFNVTGGGAQLLGCAFGTSGMILNSISSLTFERNGSGGQISVYQAPNAGGNNVTWTLGTNSSTAHGATCQVWGHAGTPTGTLACGLFLGGGAYSGRIRFSNMGANPCVRACGAGLGIALQGLSGGIADGNTDVGLDLSPSGVSGNTLGATGSTISIPAAPTVTGTAGDIRLSDGTIATWASATAGILDANGNRLLGPGNAPDHPIAVASGAGVLAVANAPAGATTYARYFKLPDGAGGFFTVGSTT